MTLFSQKRIIRIIHTGVAIVLAAIFFVSCNSENEQQLFFIGDSNTYQWDVKRMFPTYCCVNMGVNGSRIEDCLKRRTDFHDGIVILWIGTNNLRIGQDNAKKMKPIYEQLFDSLKAHQIYVLSVAPQMNKESENEIRQVNLMLKNLCSQSNIVYVDIYHKLQKKDLLNPEYARDNIHLNNRGLQIVATCLRQYL